MGKKPVRRKKRNRFMGIMAEKLEDGDSIKSPVALFEWFVGQWRRPLNEEILRQAYQAAWAVSIDKGLVKL